MVTVPEVPMIWNPSQRGHAQGDGDPVHHPRRRRRRRAIVKSRMQPHDRPAALRPRHMAEVEPDQLRRSAADVHDQELLGPPPDQRRAGDHRQPRLLLRRDDFEREPCLLPHLAQQFAGVARAAAGFGGDQPHAGHAMALDLALADAQRLHRPRHGGTRQPARGFEPRAQLDSLRKAVHHVDLAPNRLRDQHPAAVGSQVDRGIEPRRCGFFGYGRIDLSGERTRTRGTHGRHPERPPKNVLPRT